MGVKGVRRHELSKGRDLSLKIGLEVLGERTWVTGIKGVGHKELIHLDLHKLRFQNAKFVPSDIRDYVIGRTLSASNASLKVIMLTNARTSNLMWCVTNVGRPDTLLGNVRRQSITT